ncbi:hypothetical protein [Salinispora pacifica]|uniref:hypothetical protein n=1 Tax=Salinispora pacifica TaxID=351187 RepID=UPI000364893C|nr:hypothetical protein [Salinispora pacifica]
MMRTRGIAVVLAMVTAGVGGVAPAPAEAAVPRYRYVDLGVLGAPAGGTAS